MNYEAQLVATLAEIRHLDSIPAYDKRNSAIYAALHLATQIGYEAGIRIDPEEPEWPVAFIELPTGQISYHLPQHVLEWDKHDTDEKNRRLSEYVADAVGRKIVILFST